MTPLSTGCSAWAIHRAGCPVQSRGMSLIRAMAAVVLGSVLLSGYLSSARGASNRAIDTESGPPIMPAEAKELTEAGAVAFARHFIAQRDYAFVTGDLAPVAALRGPSCDSCTSELQMIGMTWSMGGRWEKSATIVSGISITAGQPPGAVELIARHSGGDSEVFDQNGDTIGSYPAVKDQIISLFLAPSGSSWLVSDFAALGVDE